jgi:Uma2 family endonuclease
MTVLEDRIEMAESDEHSASDDGPTLDALFQWLEESPIPEGYKTEIVGGNIFMSPQRATHWHITLKVIDQLRAKYPVERLLSDVRIDYPGHLNGFPSDVTLVADGADMDDKAIWRHQDVEFVAEVISKSTGANDYGPKKTAYAEAEVPVYLIVDPYQGRCLVCTHPKGGEYTTETKVPFGDEVDLTGTVVGLILKTAGFPRD